MDRDHDQQAADPECRIVELLPALDKALRRLWIRYRGRPGHWQQLEDHYQNLVLLLIEDDYRRLRSHDPRSSLDAWLKTIIKHYLTDWLSSQFPTANGSDVLSDTLRVEAKQEEEMIYREQVEQL